MAPNSIMPSLFRALTTPTRTTVATSARASSTRSLLLAQQQQPPLTTPQRLLLRSRTPTSRQAHSIPRPPPPQPQPQQQPQPQPQQQPQAQQPTPPQQHQPATPSQPNPSAARKLAHLRHQARRPQPAQGQKDQPPHYELTFTCVPCGTRSAHNVSKQAYHHGSVLITCPGCRNRHVIADHLRIFGGRDVTVEDLVRERGGIVKRGALGEDGDVEFWDDGSATRRAERLGPEGADPAVAEGAAAGAGGGRDGDGDGDGDAPGSTFGRA